VEPVGEREPPESPPPGEERQPPSLGLSTQPRWAVDAVQESHDWVFPEPAPALPLVRRPWAIPRLQIQDRRLRRTYLGQLDWVPRPEQAVGPLGFGDHRRG